jgi:hypothetical protein
MKRSRDKYQSRLTGIRTVLGVEWIRGSNPWIPAMIILGLNPNHTRG